MDGHSRKVNIAWYRKWLDRDYPERTPWRLGTSVNADPHYASITQAGRDTRTDMVIFDKGALTLRSLGDPTITISLSLSRDAARHLGKTIMEYVNAEQD